MLTSLSQLGLGGIVFVIWYFDSKKIDDLQDIVKEQVEEKRQMRDDRLQLIGVVERQASLIQRVAGILDRIEERLSDRGTMGA